MATHQVVFLVAGIIGFAPSIAVLYHALRTYDYPYTERSFFDSRRVFLGLAVGMILGTVSGAITVWLGAGILTLTSLVIVLLLLALFEEGFKLVYLNRKGYRGRFDTTFTGLGLGIGISALVAAGSSYTNGPNLLVAALAVQLFVFSMSLAFVHGATGAFLGYGCAQGDVLPAFAKAYVARVIHALLLVPFFVSASLPAPQDLAVPLFTLGAATVFTLFVYAHAYGFVLPNTLPPDMRRERRRGFRAVAGTGKR